MFKETTIPEARQLWPAAAEHLREAISETEEDPERFLRQLQAKIFSGIHTLWVLEDEGEPVAYAVTVVYSGDGIVTVVQIYLAQGEDLQLFLKPDEYDRFVMWALKRGASVIEIIGRKGWEKILKPYGFMHNYTSLTKRITEELH